MRRSRVIRKALAMMLTVAVCVGNNSISGALEAGDSDMPSIDWGEIDKNESYDFLVDGSLEADDPLNNKYKTLQGAYDAASAGTENNPTIIAVKPNVYDLAANDTSPDERKDKVGFGIWKDYITIIGLSDDADDVVIADNRGLNAGAASNYYSSTVVSDAVGLTMQNVTILNYCNLDYTYKLDNTKNLTKRTGTETQAFAYSGGGDKHYYKNCKFVSLLDTTYNGATRSLYDSCYVQGTNDFIMGGDTQVYYNCTIKALANHIIGGGIGNAVFINTEFLVEKESSGATYICKGESPSTLINCTIPSAGTMQWMPSLPSQYRFYYHNLKNDLGEQGNIVGNDTCAIELSAEQAEAFNLWNLLRGSDDWDPLGVKEQYTDKGSLSYRVAISPASSNIVTNETTATFTATVKPNRVAEIVKWSSTGDVSIESNGNTVKVSGTNKSKENTTAQIRAELSNGLYEVANITVAPETEPAPVFTSQPKITAPDEGKISVDYTLDLGERTDTSLITWYRCDDVAGSNPVLVADTKYDKPCRDYVLGTGDIGKYIMVKVAPKNEISITGTEVTDIYAVAITKDDVPSMNIYTDFLNVPTHPPFITEEEMNMADGDGVLYRNKLIESIPNTVKGKWNFIGNWYYNYGISDASGVMGILTGTRYCRLIYSQVDGVYGDMKLTLKLYPEKTNNTGFGSAGQYQEVLIKYNPDTQTGYGVRYERTTADAKSAFVTLYKYENGIGTPISDTVQTTAFRAECTLVVKVIGDKLSVHMESNKNINLENGSIDLEATIIPNDYGSVGIYHTGTVSGGNRTLIKSAEILYGKDAGKEDSVVLYGDYDQDGVITANDAACVLQYVLATDPSVPKEIIEISDVNGDGILTGDDAAQIYQKSLNSSFEYVR